MEPAVPKSTGRVFGAAEETVEDIITDVEDIFSPRPGGMVDRHRKRRAEQEAAAREAENAAEPVQQSAVRSVKVAQVSPEVVSSLTLTIAPGASAPVLPLSPYRYRATLCLIASLSVMTTPVTTPAFTAAGVFTQNPYPFPVQVTFLNGTTFNIFGGGAGNSQIVGAASGPVTVTIGPYQAVGWNAATVAPTAWSWAAAIPSAAILAKDSGAALGQNGYSLAPGIPVVLFTRAQVWAYNGSTAPMQISVISEMYAPE